ncbi:MAG TPA: TolC family protein [Acidobacteriaceae bacterium]|nr:TolC family protein [Acidobacteriaceae bacterium]
MAEANEQIGVARAAFFPHSPSGPRVALKARARRTGSTGRVACGAVGPELSQTLFDAARRHAVWVAAQANYDGTVAAYRQTTLNAFQEVEDDLVELGILEKEADQQHQATASAAESLQLFTNRYQGGVDNYLQVITAQAIALADQRNDIDIQRRRAAGVILQHSRQRLNCRLTLISHSAYTGDSQFGPAYHNAEQEAAGCGRTRHGRKPINHAAVDAEGRRRWRSPGRRPASSTGQRELTAADERFVLTLGNGDRSGTDTAAGSDQWSMEESAGGEGEAGHRPRLPRVRDSGAGPHL